MSKMNDIQLQLDSISVRLERIEQVLRIYGPPRVPSILNDEEPTVVQPHWAFEDPERDNKWKV